MSTLYVSNANQPREPVVTTSNLTFTSDSTLEKVYLVYTAEKNRGLTLRLHLMLTAAWMMATVKTGWQLAESLPSTEGQRKSVQCGFLLVVQFLNLFYQLLALRKFMSVSRGDQLSQERIKTRLHVMMEMAVVGAVVLSDPDLPHAPLPSTTAIVTAFLAVVDMLRVETLLHLQKLNWLVFALLEVDRWMKIPNISLRDVASDVAYTFILATILPLVVAAVSEVQQREAFLRDCKKPMRSMGPFWLGFKNLMRQLGGQDTQMSEQEPHLD